MKTTFNYTGSPVDWIVPDGVTNVQWVLGAAPGGRSTQDLTKLPRPGGKLTFSMAVASGVSIRVTVGGFGGDGSTGTPSSGGFNGGGQGGKTGAARNGAGGGGATDLRFGGTDSAHRIAVAGGGGGNAKSVIGGIGGVTLGGAGGILHAGSTQAEAGSGSFGGNAAGTTGLANGGAATTGATQNGGAGQNASAGGKGGTGGGDPSPITGTHSGGGAGGGGYAGGGGGGSSNTVNGSSGGGGNNFCATSTSMGAITSIVHTLAGGATALSNGFVTARFKVPPFVPDNLSPRFGSYFDAAAPIDFQWRYKQDTDLPLNHLASDFRYREIGTSVWTVITNVNTDPTITNNGNVPYSLPGGTLPINTAFEWGVRSRNTDLTTYSPWTSDANATFTTDSIPATPVWIRPVDGSTIDTLPLRAVWTSVGQFAWQIQQLDGDGTVVWDSGEIDLPLQTALISPTGIGITGTLQLRISDGTVWSAWASIAFTLALSPTTLPITSEAGLQFQIQNGLTGDDICNLVDGFGLTFLDQNNGAGGGSFSINLASEQLKANPTMLNQGNIVRVKNGNIDLALFIGEWVIQNTKTQVVASEEGIAEIAIVSGPSPYGAWLSQAVVFPEQASQKRLGLPLGILGNVRQFGFASDKRVGHWYDGNQWFSAIQMARQDAAVHIDFSHPTGSNWVGYPASFPDPLAYWIWWRDARENETTGLAYFRTDIVVAGTDPYQVQLFAAAQDGFEAFIDGVSILNGLGWQTTYSSSVFYLEPGNHVLTFAVAKNGKNGFPLIYTDPAGLIFSLIHPADTVAGTASHVLVHSDSITHCQGFPGISPSWTPGDILLTLFGEALAREVTSFRFMGCSFDDKTDTYGKPWPKSMSRSFTIGETYASVVDKMTQDTCDVWTDEQGTLSAAPVRGVDRASIVPVSGYVDFIAGLGPRYWFRLIHQKVQRSLSVWNYATQPVDTFSDEAGLLIAIPNTDGDMFIPDTLRVDTAMPGASTEIRGATAEAPMNSVLYLYPDPEAPISVPPRVAAPIAPTEGYALEFRAGGLWAVEQSFFDDTIDTTTAGSGGVPIPLYVLALNALAYDINSTLIRTRVNLCTNPMAATATTGWTAIATTTPPTLSRTTARYLSSPASFHLVFVSTAAAGSDQAAGFSISGLTIGNTYTISAEVYRVGGGGAPNICMHIQGAAAFGAVTTEFDEWERISETIIATATTHVVQIRTQGTVVAATEIWFSHVLIEASPFLDYFIDTGTTAQIYSRQLMQLDWQDENLGIFLHQEVSIPADEVNTHHYVVQVVYGNGTDFVLIFRDAQIIVTMPVPSAARPTWWQGLIFVAPQDHAGMIAEIAYFDTYFTPEEVSKHYSISIGDFTNNTPVIMGKGKNVINAGSEQQLAAITDLLTKSADSFFEVVARQDQIDKYGRIEGFYDGSSKETADARSVASSTLAGVQTLTSATLDFLGGYVPWRDFHTGDWILAPSDTDPKIIPRRVVSIGVAADPDTGRSIYTLEVDAVSQEPDRRLATWLERVTPTGSLGGLIADSG